MLIGELATRTGLSHDTLRYYERAGLIRAQRGANGYRRYPADAQTRLALVRLAQGLGFSLAEIRDVLGVMDRAGELPAEQVQGRLQAKLAEMDARLAELQRLRQDLAQRLADVCPLRLGGPAPAQGGARPAARPALLAAAPAAEKPAMADTADPAALPAPASTALQAAWPGPGASAA